MEKKRCKTLSNILSLNYNQVKEQKSATQWDKRTILTNTDPIMNCRKLAHGAITQHSIVPGSDSKSSLAIVKLE